MRFAAWLPLALIQILAEEMIHPIAHRAPG